LQELISLEETVIYEMKSVISAAGKGKRGLFSEILSTDYPRTSLNIFTFYCEYIGIYFRYITYIHAFL
jgi:hypothetical protein